MAQTPESPRDLHVRMALIEQALMHSESMASLHQGMADARMRTHEEHLGRLSGRLEGIDERVRALTGENRDLSLQQEHQAEALSTLEARQTQTMATADRMRWGIAAVLAVLGILAGVAPETLGKVSKVLAVLP